MLVFPLTLPWGIIRLWCVITDSTAGNKMRGRLPLDLAAHLSQHSVAPSCLCAGKLTGICYSMLCLSSSAVVQSSAALIGCGGLNRPKACFISTSALLGPLNVHFLLASNLQWSLFHLAWLISPARWMVRSPASLSKTPWEFLGRESGPLARAHFLHTPPCFPAGVVRSSGRKAMAARQHLFLLLCLPRQAAVLILTSLSFVTWVYDLRKGQSWVRAVAARGVTKDVYISLWAHWPYYSVTPAVAEFLLF